MPLIAIFSRTATWRMTTSKNGRAGEDIFRSLQEKWEERRAGIYDLFGKAVGCARINQKLEALHLLPRNMAYIDLDVALALSGRAWRWPHPHGFSILNTQFSLLSPQALKGAGRNTTFVISSPPVRQDASEGSALSAAPGKHTHTHTATVLLRATCFPIVSRRGVRAGKANAITLIKRYWSLLLEGCL